MTLFILSTADMFLIMAASSDSSPYANMGASREMLQMMAYEPLTLLIAVGFYLTEGSFQVSAIIDAPWSARSSGCPDSLSDLCIRRRSN